MTRPTSLRDQGAAGIWIFIGVFIVAAGLGLLPTYAQAVVAGWVFGAVYGSIAAMAGFAGASLLAYGFVRYVSKDGVANAISKHPRAAVVREALVGGNFWRTFLVVTLIRVPPNSPFALTNLALTGVRVPLGTYLAGTVLGMTPRTVIVVAMAAAAAASAQETGAENLVQFIKDSKSPMRIAIGVGLVIVVFVILHRFATSALNRFDREQKALEELTTSEGDPPAA